MKVRRTPTTTLAPRRTKTSSQRRLLFPRPVVSRLRPKTRPTLMKILTRGLTMNLMTTNLNQKLQRNLFHRRLTAQNPYRRQTATKMKTKTKSHRTKRNPDLRRGPMKRKKRKKNLNQQ